MLNTMWEEKTGDSDGRGETTVLHVFWKCIAKQVHVPTVFATAWVPADRHHNEGTAQKATTKTMKSPQQLLEIIEK